jgi:hypothetical protein
MRHHTTATGQAIWGAIAGAALTAIVLVMAGMVSAGVYPLLLIERLDPLFMGHAIFGPLLLGALAGAVIAGLFFARRISK